MQRHYSGCYAVWWVPQRVPPKPDSGLGVHQPVMPVADMGGGFVPVLRFPLWVGQEVGGAYVVL